MNTGIKRGILLLSALWAALIGGPSGAQTYPTRPITFVVPYGVGGGSDTLQRAAVLEASKLIGQNIIYENRPGGSNRLNLLAIRNAPADGYLIGGSLDGVLVLQPLVDPNFKLQPMVDYVPVAMQFETALAFIATATKPFKDIAGLKAYALANPGKLNMAIGIGGSSHVLAERIRSAMGIDMVLIGYKASAQSYIDLRTGRIDLVLASDKRLVDSGQLVALATTGKTRWKSLPQVPTLTEAGVPVAASLWFAVIAKPGTPPDIVAKLNTVFSAAVRTPDFNKRLEGTGFTAMPAMTPEQATTHIRNEMTTMEPIIRKANIKLE